MSCWIAEADIEKLVVLVPELVNMTGITEAMKNNFTVMTDVGKITRLAPAARQEALQKFINDVNSTKETKDLLESELQYALLQNFNNGKFS